MRLNDMGINTHFVRRLNMREQLVRELEIIPLAATVCNVAAGPLAERLGLAEGTVLPRSIIEYNYRNEALGNPLVAEEHITAFGWASAHDLDDIMAVALRINDFLTGLFLGIGVRLVDMKLEFGRLWQNDDMRIVVADEISPDTCRLWDLKDDEKLDKDRFRLDLPNPRARLPGDRAAAGPAHRGRGRRRQGPKDAALKVKVFITPRAGVLDPQGTAIGHALASLGFSGVEGGTPG